MTDHIDLHEDYIPFSRASTRADHLFRDEQYGKALEKVEEMKKIIQKKLDRE